MPKDRLTELFKAYEHDVQQVIAEVLAFEQAHISLKEPRFTKEIKQIIDRAAQDESDDQK